MATIVNVKMKHRRGVENSMQTLAPGQLFLPTDNKRIWKGTEEGENILLCDMDLVLKNKEDIANIQGTMATKDSVAIKTTKSYKLYVNPDGSDSNNGLSVGSPFRTIQQAINTIPKVLDHVVEIVLARGTYQENIICDGFIGKGGLKISGGTSIDEASNYVVSEIQFLNCTCNVVCSGIGTYSASQHGFTCATCMNVSFVNCLCGAVSSAYAGFCAYNGGFMLLSNCSASNRANAVFVTNGAIAKVDNMTGNNNTVGINCIAGIVMKNGTQSSANTAETISSGGVIR